MLGNSTQVAVTSRESGQMGYVGCIIGPCQKNLAYD